MSDLGVKKCVLYTRRYGSSFSIDCDCVSWVMTGISSVDSFHLAFGSVVKSVHGDCKVWVEHLAHITVVCASCALLVCPKSADTNIRSFCQTPVGWGRWWTRCSSSLLGCTNCSWTRRSWRCSPRCCSCSRVSCACGSENREAKPSHVSDAGHRPAAWAVPRNKTHQHAPHPIHRVACYSLCWAQCCPSNFVTPYSIGSCVVHSVFCLGAKAFGLFARSMCICAECHFVQRGLACFFRSAWSERLGGCGEGSGRHPRSVQALHRGEAACAACPLGQSAHEGTRVWPVCPWLELSASVIRVPFSCTLFSP